MEIELDVLLIFYMYPSKCCPIMFTSDIETFRQETGIVQIAKLRTTSVQPRNCSVQPRNWEQLRNSCCENQTQRLISIVRIKPVSIVLWEPNPACCGNQTQRLICPVESYVPINCMKIKHKDGRASFKRISTMYFQLQNGRAKSSFWQIFRI